ncbi:MAG: molybdopterin-dependent oxidoreductase [Marmoricola sp.]
MSASTTSGPTGRGRWYAAAGLVAGAAGVLTSTAAGTALRVTNPVVAVAEAVRDATPGGLAERLIHLVGHADKPLLVAGTVVILLALCAGSGLLSRAHPALADLALGVLAALGLLAVATRNGAGIGAGLTVVVGFATWVVVLHLLTGRLQRTRDPVESRRGFLTMTGGVAVVAGLALLGGRALSSGRRAVEEARARLRLPVRSGVAPAGADLGVAGIPPWQTPNRAFYLIHTALVEPAIAPADWRLRIHGMVDHPLEIGYQDLLARGLHDRWITLCCVSNEVGGDLIGNAWWSGVPIRDLLAEVGVHADADAVKQTSADGWTCGTPLSALTDPDRDAMLALAMNGQPLPVEHGFPVRMVVPGLYGYVSATKWLVDLEVTRYDRFTAYWTERGWGEKGPVKTESRVDVPRDGSRVAAGTVRVGGSAWAQHTGIEAVEFQLDGGPWQPARLGTVPEADTWVQWTGEVQVDAGDHELRVRATDRSGSTQTAVRADVLPDGATGWHTVGFTAS